jgi:hypothetical protein
MASVCYLASLHTESAPGQLPEWDPAMGNFRAAPVPIAPSTLRPSTSSGPMQGTPLLAHPRASASGGQIRPLPLYQEPHGAHHMPLPSTLSPMPQSSLAAEVSQRTRSTKDAEISSSFGQCKCIREYSDSVSFLYTAFPCMTLPTCSLANIQY